MDERRQYRGQALRRYPALGFLAVAAALALILPSRLTTPRSNPATLAEFAPVPGDRGAAGGGELGEASSGGLGFGTGRGGRATPPAIGPGGAGPNQPPASSLRCVGRPARQTEDLLSPPCVGFYKGDNGGATTRGVTRDEVRIVLHLGYSTTPKVIDYDDPNATDPSAQDDLFAAVVRGIVRHFNARYQLYGRRLHVYGYRGDTGRAGEKAAKIQQQGDEIENLAPYAVLILGSTDQLLLGREFARRKMVAISYGAFDRDAQRQVAPYLLSFTPDLQDQARITAGYVCRRLAGGNAVYSGNALDRGRRRHFGILYQDDVDAPEHVRLKDLFKQETTSQCGLADFAEASARTTNEGQADYPLNIAAMRNEEVTTVISFSGSTGPFGWGHAAQSQSYYPEWIVPGRTSPTGVDDNSVARQYEPLVWANAFGLSYDRRRGSVVEQPWYAAWREGCPDCSSVTDTRSPKFYEIALMMMWGIQAAGPRLTPANMDKGLHAIPERASTDPAVPAAYFSPGNYSWIKDAMPIWWDNTGREPGGNTAGWYRLPGGGARYRAPEWPSGDRDVKAQGPCQGPNT